MGTHASMTPALGRARFNFQFGSKSGGGRRRGCAPPAPPCFLATEPLSGVELFSRNPTFSQQATCPGQLRCLGQIFSQKSDLFLNKPLVPGSFAAWGRTFPQNVDFLFEQATCPGQLRCLRQNVFSFFLFFYKPLLRGNFAAWGRTFSQKPIFVC